MTKMYNARNCILLHTDYADPDEHRHMAAHAIISLGKSMTAVSDDKAFHCRGIMIPSGVTHKILTHDHPSLIFLFNDAAHITDIQVLTEQQYDELCGLYYKFEHDISCNTYNSLEQHLLHYLGLKAISRTVTDERILSAMQLIRAESAAPLSCKYVADSVFLSQSRFSHLFRQQTGMTFAAYLIHQRLLHTYAHIIAGGSVTDAALEAGFSSITHFSDANRRIFGLNASSITRNLIFTKIQ